MSTATRFQTSEGWSLIPGPGQLAEPMNSQDLQDIEVHSPVAMAESFLSFPDMRLLHPATPSWWSWRARWERGADFIEVGMTLFEDEAQSWGGSPITANCSIDAIEALWSYLQSQHRGVWLHGPDCVIHTQDSFREGGAF
jgi:hypothetical protein